MKKEKNVLLLLTLSSKKCPCCGEVKPTTEFTSRRNHGKWGFYCWCKACVNKKYKKYYKENPEMFRKHNLKRYGITPEDKEKMLENQGYKCAICGEEIFLFRDTKNKKKDIAHVDHDHDTGEVRGLLCDKCNRGLGYFRDNTEYLLSAVSYLKKNK